MGPLFHKGQGPCGTGDPLGRGGDPHKVWGQGVTVLSQGMLRPDAEVLKRASNPFSVPPARPQTTRAPIPAASTTATARSSACPRPRRPGYSLRSGQQACEGQCPCLCSPPLDPGPQPDLSLSTAHLPLLSLGAGQVHCVLSAFWVRCLVSIHCAGCYGGGRGQKSLSLCSAGLTKGGGGET